METGFRLSERWVEDDGGASRAAAEADLARSVEVLKALAHPTRLQVIEALCRGEERVTALAERLRIPQPILSQQLGILRAAGLVSATRQRGTTRYRVEQPGLRGLLRCMACRRPR